MMVGSLCKKRDINIPHMDDMFKTHGLLRRDALTITNMKHYRIEILYTIIDMQARELSDRFTETTTDLLACIACLNPTNSIAAFNRKSLIELAQFYPKEFSSVNLKVLDNQLQTFIIDV